jgi:phage repressor protein C with HTH and peptisase S24 domain
MIKIIKVTGKSLSPIFLPGDYVITSKSKFLIKEFRLNDFIVFFHPALGVLIKKILDIDPGEKTFKVAGTNPSSISSRSLGNVHQNDIIGKVIWHFKKPRSQ